MLLQFFPVVANKWAVQMVWNMKGLDSLIQEYLVDWQLVINCEASTGHNLKYLNSWRSKMYCLLLVYKKKKKKISQLLMSNP